MIGKIKQFNRDTGHGIIEGEDTNGYFFSYVECSFPASKIKAGAEVQFDLRYVDSMPIASNITKECKCSNSCS